MKRSATSFCHIPSKGHVRQALKLCRVLSSALSSWSYWRYDSYCTHHACSRIKWFSFFKDNILLLRGSIILSSVLCQDDFYHKIMGCRCLLSSWIVFIKEKQILALGHSKEKKRISNIEHSISNCAGRVHSRGANIRKYGLNYKNNPHFFPIANHNWIC